MTRFTPARGLNEQVAARLIAPAVTRLAEAAADTAKIVAPLDKVWVTRGDEVVRPEHRDADGQTVPENLRFTLASPFYDQLHYGVGEKQMGRAPHDEESFSPGLTANCRCGVRIGPGIALDITAHPAQVAGTLVTGTVTCDHALCVSAEFGTADDQGTRYMAAGLRAARARLA